ncbi:MAG: hypothetical protein R3F56_06440 [Planctomycetota bacterium]
MTVIRPLPALLLVCVGLSAQEGQTREKDETARIDSVGAALDTALAKARTHAKRVLVVWTDGGAAGEALAKAMKARALSHLLQYEYAVATVSAIDGAALAKQLGCERLVLEPPAAAVLDAERRVLARLGHADLFEGDAVAAKALTEKLGELKAEPLDGDAVLAAGLARAKKLDLRVFVRFDAPW